MWKVKRMNTARIVDLTIANGAGGIAVFLASGSPNQSAAPAAPVAQLQTLPRRVLPPQTATTANGNFINQRGEGVSAVRYGAASRPAMQT
jgi:hypothetical protein